ncbi:GTP cyclohydrolase-2 [uncultured Gammaproteobacteria bacterium]
MVYPHFDRSPDRSALRAVDRAMADLRRADAVIVTGEDGQAGLVMAAEMISSSALMHVRRLSGAEPTLVVPRRRAAALGLSPDGLGVVQLLPRHGPLTEALVSVAITPEAVAGRGKRSGLDAVAAEAVSRDAAAVGLIKLAQLLPAAVMAPLSVDEIPDLELWAAGAETLIVRAADIAEYQIHGARTLTLAVEAVVPLAACERSRVFAFRPANGGPEHLAIVIGDPDPTRPVLARLHSECFTGDLLGSLRCDCGDQLRGAIAEIARIGSGVLLYLAQEGRGIGLVNKLRAYRLQDQGIDTIDANEILGFEADERLYLPAAEMLRHLGYTRVRLMTNNPDKLQQLARCGIEVVERVVHIFPSNGHNAAYLRAKAERGGHLF